MPMTDNLRGVILMTVAMAAFVGNDAIMKVVTADLPLFQVIFLRGLVTIVGLGLILGRRGWRVRGIEPRERRLIGLRTIGELAATASFLFALTRMPLATLSAIMQAVPLVVTLAAAVFLRAPIGIRRLMAIIVGFFGVLLIVRPGSGDFGIEAVLGLVSVGFVVLRDLTTRQMDRQVPSAMIALVAAIAVTAMGAIGTVVAGGWVPVPMRTGLLILCGGGFLVAGYLTAVSAMRVGDIDLVAPLRYSSLIFALILGWVVFGDWPATLTLIGAAIVVATGIYTFYREQQLARGVSRR
jgi:drug/metabolite transporter (DMT)-like permease